MSATPTITCPLCNDAVDKLFYRFHFDSEREIIERLKKKHPDWTENDGLCGRCVDYYHTEVVMSERMMPEVGPYFPVKSADDFIILPTGLRLNADPRFTGKGVTICFIDSSFYSHPDLISHRNRIKIIVDITDLQRDNNYFFEPHEESWHGTMTTVVCAGDGFRSNGLYKGIASEAELVLLKVQNDAGKITAENIATALQWILDHHEEYEIKIVNMSLGDDANISYKESKIDQLAERLIEKGITIVAAVGNDEQGTIKPPANSPNVISVGGIDDENSLMMETDKLYHSSFGKTVDQLMKPELLAQAIWIAAPILPKTKEEKEAAILYGLLNTNEDDLKKKLESNLCDIRLNDEIYQSNDVSFIRQGIVQRIQDAKYISPAYVHVDGTSFAAPIVTAVIAQMLQANHNLKPSMIREALFSSAKRIPSQAPERQGFGVIQPRKTILKVLKRNALLKPNLSPYINQQQKTIEFYIQNDCASQISLVGSFNNWADDVLLMEAGKNGLWRIEIPMLPSGRYYYKFFVDEKMWIEDVDNPYREPDGFNGFNSILIVEYGAN